MTRGERRETGGSAGGHAGRPREVGPHKGRHRLDRAVEHGARDEECTPRTPRRASLVHNNHVLTDEDDLDDLDDLCYPLVVLSDFPRLPRTCADTSATWTVESVCAPSVPRPASRGPHFTEAQRDDARGDASPSSFASSHTCALPADVRLRGVAGKGAGLRRRRGDPA